MYKRLLFVFFVFCGMMSYGQNIHQSHSLEWQGAVAEEISENIKFRYLYFKDAHLLPFENCLMPVFVLQIPVENSQVRADLSLENTKWVSLSSEEVTFIDKSQVPEKESLNTEIVITKRQPFLEIRFMPFRKNGSTYEKLISFDIKGSISPSSQQKTQKSRTYASNSILRSGSFYKISIQKTGIHKITHSDFKALGISVSNLKTSSIALFGNGGKMLPENTSDFVIDDLQEVPILVVDNNNDGVFGEDDYVLFYGLGIINWDFASPYFTHQINFYSDYAYYFISVDASVGSKKRVRTVAESPLVATHQVSSYYYHDVIEEDNVSPNGVSRIWFTDVFDAVTEKDYSFTIPEVASGENVNLRLAVAAKSGSYSQFTIKSNTHTSAILISSSSDGTNQVGNVSFSPDATTVPINLTYSKPTNSSVGWLDYIELHAVCKLKPHTNQFSFRNPEIVGENNVAEYSLNTDGKSVTVWDVTHPHDVKKIQTRLSGNEMKFKLPADSLKEYVAFYGSSFYAVSPIGKIENQNLHAKASADFVIVTHPSFYNYASQLADFRKKNDNMTTLVVKTTEIYNEFGSGAQDIGAIRNFLKMLYDKYPSSPPKNVLLLGKASYDFRDRKESASNFIPNYQGSKPFEREGSLSTDDFFVKWDDNEGLNNAGSMDAGVGRIPAANETQAKTVIQKSIDYASTSSLVSGTSSLVSNLGDWRNIVTLCADDDADQSHFSDANTIADYVAENFPVINIDKIYLDAYKKVSTSQGQRFPEATNALNQRVNRGTLFLSYTGHGGDNGWAHERFLKRSDIAGWNNKYNQPLFYAGSCSFGVYDKVGAQSPSEDMLFKSDGGGIGVISATRNSYGSTNSYFGRKLHQFAFTPKGDNTYHTMGEFFSEAKNASGSVNMYVLFGDPSLKLAIPKQNIVTDSINGVSIRSVADTIMAMQFVTIKGRVVDGQNNTLTNFNGFVFPTVFDKPSVVTTLLNNPSSVEKVFELQKNILFRGKATVKNGAFEFSFIVPKDINYEYGFGKISYYGYGENTDANGFDSIFVGGIKDTLINDNMGPEIKLYLNDESFVSGGIATKNPTLYALISDENGINTVGTGIGHDIVAILDDDLANAIVLNDFFEYQENSYTAGKITYLLSNLSTGQHKLTLRAWDVLNNMGETSINFTVVNNDKLQLEHVLNYPNPFTTNTQFYFEHNQPNTTLTISIQIFTISGKLVKTIEHVQNSMSLRCGPIPWNGRDDFGDKLAKGVYLYKLRVKTPDNKTAEKIEKIVIL